MTAHRVVTAVDLAKQWKPVNPNRPGRKPDPIELRFCERCGKPLERKRFKAGALESKIDYAKRRFCPSAWRSTRTNDGRKSHPLYNIWSGIIERCLNPRSDVYWRYGGKGITIYPSWRDDFWAFAAHMGERPSPKHSVDRYPDNDGNYEPGNVRWATAKQQTANSRVTKYHLVGTENVNVNELAKRLKVTRQTVWHRARKHGWAKVVNDAEMKP